MANEFTRIAHATGSNAMDINPNKVNTGTGAGYTYFCTGASGEANSFDIPVSGYSKIAAYKGPSNVIVKLNWVYTDGTTSSDVATLARETWSDYFDVPTNVLCARFTTSYTNAASMYGYLSIIN